ncbi:hypothetical protein, partial [Streptomyces anulatus]|uniref:hypothetical protein n=1 Tax=Streptomyces anulatus TaxID=1892 RepID=UPI0034406A9E
SFQGERKILHGRAAPTADLRADIDLVVTLDGPGWVATCRWVKKTPSRSPVRDICRQAVKRDRFFEDRRLLKIS